MTVEQALCTVHPEAEAVGTCMRCGRLACLACAIPVRGELVCREDALEEIGVAGEAPVAAPPSPPGTRDRIVAVALAVALIATLVPWHRFGILTSVLSAWTPEGGWWPPAACLATLGATVAALWRLRRGGRRTRRAAAALAAAGALAVAGGVMAAPPFVSHSPAPFVALGGTALAGALGLLGLRRA